MRVQDLITVLNRFPKDMAIITLSDNEVDPFPLCFYTAILRRRHNKNPIAFKTIEEIRNEFGIERVDGESLIFNKALNWEIEDVYGKPSDIAYSLKAHKRRMATDDEYDRAVALILAPKIADYTYQGDHKLTHYLNSKKDKKE